jgi:hypothetical protein
MEGGMAGEKAKIGRGIYESGSGWFQRQQVDCKERKGKRGRSANKIVQRLKPIKDDRNALGIGRNWGGNGLPSSYKE